ncbi:Crp/Fnr family transcriptional regulator [Methylobacillus arboreus]|uniref:Crp/Fnr family transcriptional regulator n=1 Tax=Methylobacillus arboreus TaxID=755170 RepID=UPI001E29A1BD|nr:Crp/Fnr family transcriptional regulator [Methylobacillus arboreus]MCB5189548.1 Crp/Fnr family transcriptional regulator [Methylobacillus arboreus]
MDELSEYLRQQKAFKTHQPEEIKFINKLKLRQLTYPAGRILVKEGASSAQLYTLLDGWAYRYRTLKNGNRQILNFLLPGDLIGLQQNLLDNSDSSVQSLTPVTLCELDKNRLWSLYEHYPALAYDITWLCAQEERVVDDNLVNVGARSGLEKIAMLLLHLYKRYKSIYPTPGKSIPFPLTQQEIADSLGLSLAHTNKTLRKLEKLGLHSIGNNMLTIYDEKMLASLADYFYAPLKPRPLLC